MGRKIHIASLIIMLVCPLIFGIGAGLSYFMPQCTWAASAPAGGCILLGINLNWLITLATIAFIGSFFAIPIGLVIKIIGTAVSSREDKAKAASQNKVVN